MFVLKAANNINFSIGIEVSNENSIVDSLQSMVILLQSTYVVQEKVMVSVILFRWDGGQGKRSCPGPVSWKRGEVGYILHRRRRGRYPKQVSLALGWGKLPGILTK